jgi:hypothetical protein
MIEASYNSGGIVRHPRINKLPTMANLKNSFCFLRTIGSVEIGEVIKLTKNHGAIISEYVPAPRHNSPKTKANNSSP